MAKICVVGAVSVDLIGISKGDMIPHDSNIGAIRLSCGGVARNIAENLHRLQSDVCLISPVGNGGLSKIVREHLENLKIRHYLIVKDGMSTCCYLAAHDNTGQLISGINDFQLADSLLPEDLFLYEAIIEQSDILVIDCNLSEFMLAYLLKKFQHKTIFVDGVSQTKVIRIRKLLSYIDFLKVNHKELEALLGKHYSDPTEAIKDLLHQGVKTVVTTNKEKPIFYNIQNKIMQTQVLEPRYTISSVGAGDGLMSGVIFGLAAGKDMTYSIDLGKKIAALTLETELACNPTLDKTILEA